MTAFTAALASLKTAAEGKLAQGSRHNVTETMQWNGKIVSAHAQMTFNRTLRTRKGFAVRTTWQVDGKVVPFAKLSTVVEG